MKILVLTSRFPCPPLGGDRLRVYHLLRVLGRDHQITLLSLSSEDVPDAAIHELKTVVEHIEVVQLSTASSFVNCSRALFSKKPIQTHYYQSAQFEARVKHYLNSNKFELVLAHLIRTADYALLAAGIPKILDLTDALSLNYDRAIQFGNPLHLQAMAQRVERKRVRRYEQRMLPLFDRGLIISPVDRNYLNRYVATDNVVTVGAGVDLDYFTPAQEPVQKNSIVFLGKLSTTPNRDAVLYFAEAIFPLIQGQIKDARLNIVGIEPGRDVLKLDKHAGINVVGPVADCRPFLQRATLSVCPMRAGAGAKNKVLESMAAGTPVVATTIGAEGLDLQPEKHIRIADEPQVFADMVVELMRNPELRASFSHAGRAIVEEKFSWESVLNDLRLLVDSFDKAHRPQPNRANHHQNMQ